MLPDMSDTVKAPETRNFLFMVRSYRPDVVTSSSERTVGAMMRRQISRTVRRATDPRLRLYLGLSGCGESSPASETLTLLAPAAPGAGWDQTARVMQQVLRSTDSAEKAQVINVPRAGGVIGLAQVVNPHEGDSNLLIMTGLIMMGAILTNDSPVTLEQVTPIARLLGGI